MDEPRQASSYNKTALCVCMFSLQFVPHMVLLFFHMRKKKVNVGGRYGN